MIVTVKTWFIAHNGKDVYHTGIAEAGTTISSGQPILETFEKESEWLAKLKEYNIEIEQEQELEPKGK